MTHLFSVATTEFNHVKIFWVGVPVSYGKNVMWKKFEALKNHTDQEHSTGVFYKISILWTLSADWQNLQKRSWIYINVVLIHFLNIFQQICCYFHSNAHCKSHWRTATEYETISNHVLSIVLHLQRGHFMKNSDKPRTNIWQFKKFIIKNKRQVCVNSLCLVFLDHFLKNCHWVPLTNPTHPIPQARCTVNSYIPCYYS